MAKSTTGKAPPRSGALNHGELLEHAGYFLARARFMALRTFHEHIGKPFELGPVEFALMVLLHNNAEVTQRRLTDALGIAQPNMAGLIQRLEARGLLERARADKDKRMQFITLTPSGSKLIRQAIAAGKGMDQKSWLGRLSPAEQAMLVELLGKTSVAATVED
jgi:DNA-binding MarR family transcriptional regulator